MREILLQNTKFKFTPTMDTPSFGMDGEALCAEINHFQIGKQLLFFWY
jgi:hypothetical protein